MSYLNVASWDRIVRIVLGLVLLALGWTGAVTGTWGVIFKWLGFLPLITGLVGFCPVYALLKIRTNKARI